MSKKNYNKYTIFTDRFPFIIVVLILVFAIIFVFQFKSKYPLSFLSGTSTTKQDKESASYSILVASPTQEEVFEIANKDVPVPIEIKSKKIEGLNYMLNLVINDKNTIKTFDSPPYKYDWHPLESGEYAVIANLVDNSNEIISSSNKVKFIVRYEVQSTTTEAMSAAIKPDTEEIAIRDIPTINLEIFEGPAYFGDDICYYRVKATVTGNPSPDVSFSKDDSGGAWGPLKTQINLTRGSPNYTLTAIAKNSAGQVMESITLNWR